MPPTFGRDATCPRCRGKGTIGRLHVEPCPVCEGGGLVPRRVVDHREYDAVNGRWVYPALTEPERRALGHQEA